MAKKHDENKDLRLISRIAHIDFANKTIEASKSTIIGNTSWGRIDYLTHYCGWVFVWLPINLLHSPTDGKSRSHISYCKRR